MEELNSLISKFKESETVEALHRYFSEKSMMEILGVDRDENTHSNFLAWLFENEVTGKVACRLLIKLLNEKYNNLTDEEKEGFKAIEDLNKININKIKVIREEFVSDRYYKNGDKIEHFGGSDGEEITGRSDILIVINEGKEDAAYIMIENKIDSGEICEWASIKKSPKEKLNQDDKRILEEDKDKKFAFERNSLWQTQFYYNYYSKQKDLKNMVFAFLTRPDREGPKCEKHFFHITYQEIMNDILCSSELLSNESECTQQCDQSRNALIKIKDYMKALGKSYSQDNLMAVEPELMHLVKTLFVDNQKLFDFLKKTNKEKEALISFWNSNVHNTPVRDILRSVLEVLRLFDNKEYKNFPTNNNRGDATVYEIIDNNATIQKDKNGLYEWIIEWYIKQYSQNPKNVESLTIEHLQHTFPSSLHCKASSARTSRITDNNIIVDFPKNKYFRIANGIWICKTGWDGPAIMSRLINYVKTLKEFENIEILEIPLFLRK